MIVVMRHAVPGFVLYLEKCSSELVESIAIILKMVKAKYGVLTRTIGDDPS